MDASNRKKKDKLGMAYGTANNKLRKGLMFYMAIQLKLDKCFHCRMLIESVEDFSIEHKTPWLNSENPSELFFDLNNIAFSHLKCNVEAGSKLPKLYANKNLKNKARHQRIKDDPDKYQHKLELKKAGYHRRKALHLDNVRQIELSWPS